MIQLYKYLNIRIQIFYECKSVDFVDHLLDPVDLLQLRLQHLLPVLLLLLLLLQHRSQLPVLHYQVVLHLHQLLY